LTHHIFSSKPHWLCYCCGDFFWVSFATSSKRYRAFKLQK